MENRRLFTFLASALAFLLIWNFFFPPPPPLEELQNPAAADAITETDPDADSAVADSSAAPDTDAGIPPGTDPVADQTPAAPAAPAIPQHPTLTTTLGSRQPDSGFALEVILNSAGASVDSVSLSPPQFRDLADKTQSVKVVGNNQTSDRTLATAIASIDKLLKPANQSLESANWKLVTSTATDTAATAVFEFDSPDGNLRLRKTYSLPRSPLTGTALEAAWQNDPTLFTVNLNFEIINLSKVPRRVTYQLQGPVGLLLENAEHTSKYRDIHLEFDSTGPTTLYVSTLQNYCNDIETRLGRKASLPELAQQLREDHEWIQQPRYAGVDVQYFSAILAPLVTQPADGSPATGPLLQRTWPMLIGPDVREPASLGFLGRMFANLYYAFAGREVDPRTADLSFRFESQPVALAPGQTVSHPYAFFVGPKRRELLDPPPFAAGQVLNYGEYTGTVARFMHILLDTFHSVGLPWWASILGLTVLVRSCLFPLSRKQAIMAARQKELQPQIKALKERCGDDQQKFAREQWDLFRKHNINPLSGCLPICLQLPIFIGLYTALNSAVDLRGQGFLWIDNLAGPDALFRLPFPLPFGMGYDFNLLPLCTVSLFLIQQKLFMPPAQDEQQAMQYRMMNFMTGIMGILFWHQPAGLSLYFISSSLWSISERKLLGTATAPAGTPSLAAVLPEEPSPAPAILPAAARPKSRPNQSQAASQPTAGNAPKGFFQRLKAAAEEMQRQAELAQRQAESQRNRDEGKGKKR
ncbi:MAG: membrane protein insertase YidC [Planctomycetota bacterium]